MTIGGSALRRAADDLLERDRKLGHRWADDTGIPLAAGLIVGEALIGVGYSLMVVFGGG
jgi:uncharacterized oligopeptide transporter (OPT) family protein